MRTLYFDCFAGASGNMILGALIAAGADAATLTSELRKLGLPDFELKVSKVDRSGISSDHVEVVIPDEKSHRHLPEIEGIISRSTLSAGVKERAVSIFRRLAAAEAAVHGIEVEKVHFHEVGGLDAIIDIVGSCIGFELLKIERFACSRIQVGSGSVNIAHGKFPVPPPAVAELLTNVPFYSDEIEGELLTPTGAAIITTVTDTYGPIPKLILKVAAYGAGTRNPKGLPNVLRILIGEESGSDSEQTEQLTLLETNIDDSSPQILGYVMERAFELGALDCWFTAIQMKKNRPATLVSVLCRDDAEQDILKLLYRETSTLGVRIQKVTRNYLERKLISVATEFGDVDVKVASLGGETVNSQPEFEDLKAAASAKGVSVKSVADAVKKALGEGR